MLDVIPLCYLNNVKSHLLAFDLRGLLLALTVWLSRLGFNQSFSAGIRTKLTSNSLT